MRGKTLCHLSTTVLAAGLLLASPVRAEVLGMSLAVNGVVCPVCAHSINMGLRRVEGIKSVKVLMGSRVNLDLKLQPGAWVEPVRLFQQISLVGYRARQDELKLRLRGTVSVSDDHLLLTLTDVTERPLRFRLTTGDISKKQNEKIRAGMESLKRSLGPDGSQSLTVEGLWRPATAPGEPASLVLTHVPAS
ncbi:MAG: heavy metal-associated domain-containing protein [Armatimonadota bacterium]